MIIDDGKLIVRKASAGSGKTFTLVKEYLKLAFSGPEWGIDMRFSHILAITFTNKAANEMKTRILKYLGEIAEQGEQSDMAKNIAEETGLAMSKLQEYAVRVQKSILHHYSDLSVYTIDSFMHRIVRTFAHDLNLPMNFDVMIEQDELIETAVDELLSLAGTEGEDSLTRILSSFAESEMEEGKSYDVKQKIMRLANELFKEGSVVRIDKLKDLKLEDFGRIMREYAKKNREVEHTIKDLGQQAVDIIRYNGIGFDDFYRGKSGIGNYFKAIAAGEKMELGNSYVLEFVNKDKLGGGKTSKEVVAKIEAIKPELCELYGKIEKVINEELMGYNTRSLLMQNLYSMAMLNKLNEIVEQDARANEMIHISEFNKQIAKVVQEEPAPFIYERVGNKYYNFLIDEFQDTSKQQWMNLVPLLDNGVGNGHTSLIVGDGKQAIYRFRNGDVSQFVKLPKVDNDMHGQNFEYVADVGTLGDNYRSCEEIVNFNNRLYDWIVTNPREYNSELNEIYRDGAQNAKKEGGYVEVGFYSEKHTGMMPVMLEEIQNQIALGYKYSDITILGRNNKLLSEIGVYLSAAGIPLVSNESFLLSNSSVVKLLKAMLHYLLDSSDRVAIMQVLQLMRDLDILSEGNDFAEDLIRNPKVVDLGAILKRDGIEINVDWLRSLTLYDCCEALIQVLHVSEMDKAYVATMLNKVAAYESRHRQDLAEFLEYFDERIDQISTQTSADKEAVQLMTIHKAKGLEARVVLYAIPSRREMNDRLWVDIDQGELPAAMVSLKKDFQSEFDSQMEDEQLKKEMDDTNVLYVATTRPKEKLIIYCDEPGATVKTLSYEVLLQNFVAADRMSVHWNEKVREGGMVYYLGENKSKGEEREKPVDFDLKELDKISYPDWTPRIRIADTADDIFAPERGENIRRGLRMHEVLSWVKKSDDIGLAVERYARFNDIDDASKKELYEQLQQMMADERVRPYFEDVDKALNEHELVYNGKVYRPDRIVFKGDEVWVVDFKTGSPNQSHHNQVKRYCVAVREMGYKTVGGCLIYIGGNEAQVEII